MLQLRQTSHPTQMFAVPVSKHNSPHLEHRGRVPVWVYTWLHTRWSHTIVGNFLWSVSHSWTCHIEEQAVSFVMFAQVFAASRSSFLMSSWCLFNVTLPEQNAISPIKNILMLHDQANKERDGKFTARSELPKELTCPPLKILLNWC